MNKTLEYYLNLPYTIEVTKDSGDGFSGWFARVVELQGCMTQADNFSDLSEMISDAMYAWIKTAIEDGTDIPEPRPQESYSGKFVVRVPKSLHRQLVETAEKEGVSLNMFISTSLGRAVGQASNIQATVEADKTSINQTIPTILVWSHIKEPVRRLLLSHGFSEDVQDIDERIFSAWVNDHIDQTRTALSMSEYGLAVEYIRTLRQGLDQICSESPLIKTYCQVVRLLEDQIIQTYRMHAGIAEQNRLQQRILAQVRESNQTRLIDSIYSPQQEKEKLVIEKFEFSFDSNYTNSKSEDRDE
jgi:antitoxin HicB